MGEKGGVMQRYGFKPSDDGKFSKFQEWDEGDLCLHTEALAEIYSIKNGFDATLAEKDATIASLREEVEGLRKEKYELMSLDTEQDDWLDAVEENDDLKDQIEKLNARIKELESEVSDRHDWQCGCSHWNGCNLPFCASCGRRPYER